MNQELHSESSNIRRRPTKINRQDKLAPAIYASLLHVLFNHRTFQMWYRESSLAQHWVLWHRNVVIPTTNGDTTHPATTDFYKRRMVALACHLQISINNVFGCVYSTMCFGFLYNFVRHVFRTSRNIKVVKLKLSATTHEDIHVIVTKAFPDHTVKVYRLSSRPVSLFLNLSTS
jgi:hypothetical protein